MTSQIQESPTYRYTTYSGSANEGQGSNDIVVRGDMVDNSGRTSAERTGNAAKVKIYDGPPLLPSSSYLSICSLESQKQSRSIPKLIILDLNGTLLLRVKPKSIRPRPYLIEFLDYLFSSSFEVMVWSSAMPKNVNLMVETVFPPRYVDRLKAVWNRDSFGLTPTQYGINYLTVKNFELVWKKLNGDSDDEEQHLNFNTVTTATKPKWDQTNTIIIDDSTEKTQLQPHNAIHLTKFDNERFDEGIDCDLINVIPYLERIKRETNVSYFIKNNPYNPLTAVRQDQGSMNSTKTVVDTRNVDQLAVATTVVNSNGRINEKAEQGRGRRRWQSSARKSDDRKQYQRRDGRKSYSSSQSVSTSDESRWHERDYKYKWRRDPYYKERRHDNSSDSNRNRYVSYGHDNGYYPECKCG
ncbi:2760_t:CDS:2 [Paraglomus brasilianum]|uniref:Mitochondrial import inner membrane translocase subunit TIM50 n=1 Tax=Paraglomus brasilianum TaxID=144538 RepID=A0A9N9FD87_9GLOM|nr:2760_t:CDS:2 [Paraglomus brasilianum]